LKFGQLESRNSESSLLGYGNLALSLSPVASATSVGDVSAIINERNQHEGNQLKTARIQTLQRNERI